MVQNDLLNQSGSLSQILSPKNAAYERNIEITLFLFYKNSFYKNHEDQISQNIKNHLRITEARFSRFRE